MLKIMTIVGTRPELIKMSRVIAEFDDHVQHVLVHTGQNYDYELNQVFFDDLEIRKPDHFLEVVGENAAQTIARVIEKADEVLAADVLVLAAPMYNFAIPSTLKAWLDHVLRAGVTFKYTETGPQGLLTGKRAYVLTARGGIYAGSGMDHQEPYLRQALAFLGIHDVQFIHAEGLNMGAELSEQGLAKAREQLAQVA